MLSGLKKVWTIFDSGMKRQSLLLLVLMVAGSFFEAVGIGVIYPILEITFSSDSGSLTGLSKWLLIQSERMFPMYPLQGLYGLAFFIFLFKNSYLVVMNYYQLNFSWINRAILASRLFAYYLRNPYDFHIQRNSASLLRNVAIGVSEIFIKMVLPAAILATELLVVCVVTFMLMMVAPAEAIIAFLAVCFFAALYYLIFRHRILRWSHEAFEASEKMIVYVNQGLGGIKATKVFGSENFFSNIFSDSITRQSVLRQRMSLVNMLPRYILETILVGGILAAMIIIPTDGKANASLIPVMGMIGIAAFRLLPSFSRISGSLTVMRSALPIVDQIHDDILAAITVVDGAAKDISRRVSFLDNISLEHISFNYEGSGVRVLSDISLKINRGECIAFVGASGAGKTTIVDCILGLLTPSEGDIKIDGSSVLGSMPAWQKHIGYIPQEIFLTDDTLRRNIAYGLADSDIDETKVLQAVEQAQLSETVANMPDGLDTKVGERGISLSGGQRQRIGIARALYREASLLIMDEATSALDSKTEAGIVDALGQLTGQRTIIIIAHRLSTVRHCDRLYFMEHGQIVDSGTFNELREKNPAFRYMCNYADIQDKEVIGEQSLSIT